MQPTYRKPSDSKKSKEKSSKDDISAVTKKPQDEKLKKSVYSVSTPRNFVQKSSTADIYVQKKSVAAKTPKRAGTTSKNNDTSPMKGLLKSSASSISIASNRTTSTLAGGKASKVARKDLPQANVTVNSPVVKKKIFDRDSKEVRAKSFDTKDANKEARTKSDSKEAKNSVKEKEVKNNSKDSKEVGRQRTKTRTLDENEVKVLTPDAVDNNAEMKNLTRKLTAKPKAFYVDLEESKRDEGKRKESSKVTKDAEKPVESKTSDEEVSYEDDFESYESDFDSYHDTHSERSDGTLDNSDDQNGDGANSDDDSRIKETEGASGFDNNSDARHDDAVRDVKDDEKMLDSGNYELRDARSASKPKPTMDFILEDGEVDVKSSLIDEGFQEMSSSSVSSMKNVHTDVLERPLFIDFTKSKANRRKKAVFERLKQRAKDLLNMITLHEMTYSLYEMKPIPYDVYMATFGRMNYTQTAVQTFDDGITEEIQTDEIISVDKWTQHPVEFSSSDIYLEKHNNNRKCSHHIEDNLTKFTFLINKNSDVERNNKINSDESYKTNPLRMYFEQKDGVGDCEMLPFEKYEEKLRNKQFNNNRLGKFLKKVESRVCNILNTNSSNEIVDLSVNSKCPFSKGYRLVTAKNITDDKLSFIKQTQVTGIILSETKSNLIFTVHSKCPNSLTDKNVLCLWDVSIAIRDPIKVLVAINKVHLARFRGDTSGIFAAGLEDGSLHVWDLSEEPTWRPDVATVEKPTEIVEVKAELTPTELDREWNSKNVNVGFSDTPFSQCLLQASAYTTSASAMLAGESCLPIAGLVLDTKSAASQDSGRRHLGQVYVLQRIGIITIWSIIQDKLKSSDMGKAYWSKIKLEKNQTISLIEQLSCSKPDSLENQPHFNLNAAKNRLSVRKKEKSLKRQLTRQKSAVIDNDRPTSAASSKKTTVLPGNWESGVICTDLKIMRLNSNDNYLVAKNCGEVICCTKRMGVVKLKQFCVSSDLSTVTTLEVSPQTPQHFIAATDNGTLSLCSVTQNRVLLTLDCRNGPVSQEAEKYQVDSKGRYLGSAVRAVSSPGPTAGVSGQLSIRSVVWGPNPCSLVVLLSCGALVAWDLTHSDIHARSTTEHAAVVLSARNDTLALLTPEGEVQVHSLALTHGSLQLFNKYAALL